MQNATLLHDVDDEIDEETYDDVLEHEMPSQEENYFCDIPR